MARASARSGAQGTFWVNGVQGVNSESAVLDTGIDENHPAFSTKSLQTGVFLAVGQAQADFDDDATFALKAAYLNTDPDGVMFPTDAMAAVDWAVFNGSDDEQDMRQRAANMKAAVNAARGFVPDPARDDYKGRAPLDRAP